MSTIARILFGTFLLTFTVVFQVEIAFAQSKSPYEQRVDELTVQFLSKIGIDQSRIDRAKALGDDGLVLLLMEVMLEAEYNPLNFEYARLEYEKGLKMAEHLKTDVDLKREKAEQELKQQAQEQEDKRREQLIAEMVRREKLNDYNSSDLGGLYKNIENDFVKWYSKGEFEKSEHHQRRLNDKNDAFDSICYTILKNKIKWINVSNFDWELGEYNADKESFPLRIVRNKSTLDCDLPVSLSAAPKFKADFIEKKWWLIEIPMSEADWCFYQNQLFPQKIIISGMVFNVTKHLPNLNQITLNSDQLGLSSYFPQSQYFDLAEYVTMQRLLHMEAQNKKYQSMLDIAESLRQSGNLSESLKVYYKIQREFPDSTVIQGWVKDLEVEIKRVNREELVQEGEMLILEGLISEGIQKLHEANQIESKTETSRRIMEIKLQAKEAESKHTDLRSLYYPIREHPDTIEIRESDHSDLEDIKTGYGDTYFRCVRIINSQLKNRWDSVSNDYEAYQKTVNIRVWTSEDQDFQKKILEYLSFERALSSFQYPVMKSLNEMDKKYLKILKLEDDEEIIRSVCNL